jgi:hypothetical protein
VGCTKWTVALYVRGERINCGVGCGMRTQQDEENSCTKSSGNIPLVKPKWFSRPRSKVRWGLGGGTKWTVESGLINCGVESGTRTRQDKDNSCTESLGNIPLVKPKWLWRLHSKVRWWLGGGTKWTVTLSETGYE